MTETQPPQPVVKPARRIYRQYIDIAFSLFLLPALAYFIRKYGFASYEVLGLVLAWLPMILIAYLSWNHVFHPERLPKRWSEHSPTEARLTHLYLLMTGIFILAGTIKIFFGSNRTHGHDGMSFLIVSIQAWSIGLSRYIDYRKYIPPPDQPYDPSKRSRPKPFRSDHWGQRETL
jgi:hypothetical protein